MSITLKRVRQCEKCPWRVETDPHTIPDGYTVAAHRALSSTIAKEDETLAAILSGGALHLMACHEHPVGEEAICVGWLMNQLGPGNNIPLRFMAREITNLGDVKLRGEQHERFEDTLPKGSDDGDLD